LSEIARRLSKLKKIIGTDIAVLNTYVSAAFFLAFEPCEARHLIELFELNYTPKFGSWFNMAEIELSVLVRQCADRRIPDKGTLLQEWKA